MFCAFSVEVPLRGFVHQTDDVAPFVYLYQPRTGVDNKSLWCQRFFYYGSLLRFKVVNSNCVLNFLNSKRPNGRTLSNTKPAWQDLREGVA